MASWQSGDVAPPPSKGHEVADCNPWSLIMAYDLEFVFCGLDETYFGIWNSDIVVWMKGILEFGIRILWFGWNVFWNIRKMALTERGKEGGIVGDAAPEADFDPENI